MYEVKYDEKKCLSCRTQDCLIKCQYIDIDKESAKKEILKIGHGEDSFVLHECVTCYACEEYCPMNNHPFYLIVEKQEELDIPPLPRPLIQRGINLGVPFRGEPVIEKVNGRSLLMGVFSDLMFLIQGKLFEGVPVISSDPRKMFHYFCQLMYLHYARTSVINDRLPKIIETIAKHEVDEVICFHDECYGTYTSYCSAVGIEVPFKPVHFFEFLYDRLKELKDEIEPVNLKVAYQRPCSSRLSSDKHHFVQDIFELIGAEAVEREYVDENALCCGGTIVGQRQEGSRKRAAEIEKKNIEDMKSAGAEVCVFNCPACYNTMAQIVTRNGIAPIYMSDLCRLAIGENPAGWR
ncbi:MAG: (Fe-S)-binding protein [Deltaproteobacteria bacterium]|nr:(Fe-S)-binding protein [Deltaproteobacteria bacterium]MBW2086730.1 (Fe-S)-binding protein [Deltaproteobacteria bacterium]